ncbi:MAG TPA: metal ABC transporter substrate-binding protein [Acidimicrobiales bacterium]|nr:metal ABC transporter substrate-binding protein [Acidimicrobiales bacterium]
MPRLLLTLLAASLLLVAACGDDDGAAAGGGPRIAVTTAVLGDVVGQLLAGQAEVVTIMPRGASPHDFQASAQQAASLAGADAIVVNGGGFEEGLLSVVEAAAADGVPVVEALDAAGEEEAAGHEAADGDEHEHEAGVHFFTDPLLMADAVEGIADGLASVVPALDEDRLQASADELREELEVLHGELAGVLDAVPADRRKLVTDHDVFGAFAERYGFEVIDTVVPSGTTSDGVSGGSLARLADTLRRAGVRAVFTEATASADLAETLAAEVGDVEVVPLHAETLGPEGSGAGTYAGMLRENAARIAAALGR